MMYMTHNALSDGPCISASTAPASDAVSLRVAHSDTRDLDAAREAKAPRDPHAALAVEAHVSPLQVAGQQLAGPAVVGQQLAGPAAMVVAPQLEAPSAIVAPAATRALQTNNVNRMVAKTSQTPAGTKLHVCVSKCGSMAVILERGRASRLLKCS